MLPKSHIFFGAIFTIVIWIFAPNLNFLNVSLIFFSSFLTDFDHYFVGVKTTKSLSLKKNFKYFKNLMDSQDRERKKGHFFIFHTIEFHILIAVLSLVWTGFFYIFLGMVFHSLLDLFSLLQSDKFYTREFFLTSWLFRSLRSRA